MRDPHFGHRNVLTGEPEGSSSEKTDWDYALIAAYQVIQDNTGSDGVLSWENDSDNIEVQAIKKTNKFEQSRENYTGKKNYKKSRGEVFVPRVKKLAGEWPTWSDWVQAQIDEEE